MVRKYNDISAIDAGTRYRFWYRIVNKGADGAEWRGNRHMRELGSPWLGNREGGGRPLVRRGTDDPHTIKIAVFPFHPNSVPFFLPTTPSHLFVKGSAPLGTSAILEAPKVKRFGPIGDCTCHYTILVLPTSFCLRPSLLLLILDVHHGQGRRHHPLHISRQEEAD